MKENNLNNNQINKLNLPTTWTKKKMMSLLLVGLAGVERVKAGQAFKNCAVDVYGWGSDDDFTPLNSDQSLDSKVKWTCCAKKNGCVTYAREEGQPCTNGSGVYLCNRIDQKAFCLEYRGLCGGVAGNSPITKNKVWGNCSSYDNSSLLVNHLSTVNLTGLSRSYARYNFSLNDSDIGSAGLYCSWDNGGWTCRNGDPSNGLNAPLNKSWTIPSCYLQWPATWPGSDSLNPYPFKTSDNSSNSTSTLTTLGTSLTSPDNNSNSDNGLSTSNKIALGTGLGLGIPGFSLTAFGSWLAWKQYKKETERRKSRSLSNSQIQNQPINTSNNGQNDSSIELVPMHNDPQEESSTKAQIETPAKDLNK